MLPVYRILVFSLLTTMLSGCWSDVPPNLRWFKKAPPIEALPVADPCRSFDVGQGHYMVVDHEGVLWTWGSPLKGQLGYQSRWDRTQWWPRPVDFSGKKVKCVGAGEGYSVAITEDGSVWQWGRDDLPNLSRFAERKDPTLSFPERLEGISDAVGLATGARHFLVLLRDGSVVSWGTNDAGELGHGTWQQESKPRAISTLTQVKYISAGISKSFAIDESGNAWAWGHVCLETEGVTCTRDDYLRPDPWKLPIQNAVEIEAGHGWVLVLTRDGRVWSAGANDRGQLGQGRKGEGHHVSFLQVRLPEPVVDIAAGSSTAYAVNASGYVYGWGMRIYRRVGIAASWNSPGYVVGPAGLRKLESGAGTPIGTDARGCYHAFGYTRLGGSEDKRRPEESKGSDAFQKQYFRPVTTKEYDPICG